MSDRADPAQACVAGASAGGEPHAALVGPPTVAMLEGHLAPYAAHSAQSRGRRFPEAPPSARTEFQRDRDRIVHSTAFRRLEYKTQVFVNHEGDLFRTRLTHSLEVAQIARSVARNLCVNEDLVEAISLAHDLGHTPFGHAGQDALNECMREHGGFEHNLQSLAVVDELEEHYGGFDGLNLCFETREGILKHCSRENALRLGELGERFLTGKRPSLEAQIANIADEIAYNNHDVDDGLRSGLLTIEQLAQVELWQTHHDEAKREHAQLDGRRIVHETVRRMINTLIVDLIETTRQNLAAHAPASLDAVRSAPPLVAHSGAVAAQAAELKRFLFKNLYRHYRVMRMSSKARRVIRGLFEAFSEDPRLLPPAYLAEDEAAQPRLIAHYIAGMTDRYALKEYQRLFVINDN
ncbi:deoxyguanosinetriphosphate triphosphohydrolase [Trinickia acidisoli]|uniref:deoxyguanosinetriphosphate triphosphohydrolase n=1 Tax=Trinickia acidisoli TaxID=2767482 RepID=UPI001A8DDA2A|nr:deoxyguanosinetriphosphate triphosphohydrolase [Trinickia acidisoli]